MDFQNNYNNSGNPPYPGMPTRFPEYCHGPSLKMEGTAIILSILSVIGGTCLYLSLPCGALAIILGLLSKGECRRVSPRARVAIVLGAVGLVVTILIYSVTIYNLFQTYGSFDGIIQNYYDTYGVDYNSLLNAM